MDESSGELMSTNQEVVEKVPSKTQELVKRLREISGSQLNMSSEEHLEAQKEQQEIIKQLEEQPNVEWGDKKTEVDMKVEPPVEEVSIKK